MPFSTVVIVNPHAGGGRARQLWPELRTALDATVGTYATRWTTRPGEATEHARTALRDGYDRVLAVGGDGTLNEVANGFFDGDTPIRPSAVLAPISCGTGSDFRRSLDASMPPEAAVHTLLQDRFCTIDLGRLRYTTEDGDDATRHFVNIASFGMGGAVDHLVQSLPMKARRSGRLAYLYAILHTLVRQPNVPVDLSIDGVPRGTFRIRNVAVANGRFFGGGLPIAPRARLDDGRFDVIVLGDLTRRALLRHAHRFYRGTHTALKHVFTVRGTRITATPTTDATVRLDVDGEPLGRLPATFEIVPQALRVQY